MQYEQFGNKAFYACLITLIFSLSEISGQSTRFKRIKDENIPNLHELNVYVNVSINGEIIDTLFYHAGFDNSGNCIVEKQLDLFTEDRRYLNTSYIYKDGKCVQSIEKGSSINRGSKIYKYNDLNQKIIQYSYDNPDFTRLSSTTRYFYENNYLTRFFISYSSPKETVGIRIDLNKAGKELRTWENGKLSVENFYKDDSILLKRVYNLDRSQNNTPTEVNYKWDEYNNLVERSLFNFDTKELTSTMLYTYDSFGNLLEAREVVKKIPDNSYSSSHLIIYQYDKNNMLVAEKWYENDKKLKFHFYAEYKFYK